jgi:hypothetical protein
MLPAELLLEISSFLSTEDKCSFALVCRSFSRNVCWSDEELVEHLLGRCMLDKNIDRFSAPQRVFDTALRKAAQQDFASALLLLEHGKADPSAFPDIADWLFADANNLNDVDKLLEDPRLRPQHGVASIVEGGRLEILKHILEDGRLDPAAENNLALLRAVQYGDPSLVDALISSGKVETSDQVVLSAALARGSTTICLRLSLPLPLTFREWPVHYH